MLNAKIESILFVAARPLAIVKLAEICGAKKADITKVVDELAESYSEREAGIRLVRHGESVQMATSEGSAELVREFLKDETTGELTKPSLETLTIVAYRGPMTKAEIEQVRGVNCSLILRNLMMRGLVEAQGEHGNPLTAYSVTMDFLRFLGVSSVEELPEYETLRSNENVMRVLNVGAEAGPTHAEASVSREGAEVREKETAEAD
ncbi:MAG: SMC-Scp complex subunit ScpB [Patescibacteria group bacterium]|nr:SMC-Scp complex subunit ScpB [Patescibacteria group bacterium]